MSGLNPVKNKLDKKIYFEVNNGDNKLCIRAGCVILTDTFGNVFMIDEYEQTERGHGVIGFPGGVVDANDVDLIETVVRETYEECLLKGNETKHWKKIYKKIVSDPKTDDEYLFHYLYKQLIECNSIYVHKEPNASLATMYFRLVMPYWFNKYIIDKYKTHTVPISLLDALYKVRYMSSEREALEFPIMTNHGYFTVRQREIRVGKPQFVKFLQYGISYTASKNLPPTVDEILKKSMLYNVANNAKSIISRIREKTNKLAAEITCILLYMPLDKNTYHMLLDYLYRTDKFDSVLESMKIINHIKYNVPLADELHSIANLVKSIQNNC